VLYILISAFAGGLITIVTSKLLQKRSRFVIERNDEEFKQGHNLPIGANLQILFGQREITNFRITRFSIKNESTNDFENIKIRIWSGPDRYILHDQIRRIDFLDEIPYHPEFVAVLQPSESGKHSESQINKYYTQREYLIPTLNRFDIVEITVVSTVEPQKDSNVWIEIPHKGIRVINKYNRTFLIGAPHDEIWPYTLFFIIILIALSALFFQNPWIIALIAGLGSGFGSYFGAIIYKTKKWVFRKITD